MTNEELVMMIQNDNDRKNCLEKLYSQNKNMIAGIANKYKAFIEFDDLMQEGFFGLCKACEHFDACKGVKFLTYATYHIEQQISRYVADNKSTVRTPVYQGEAIRKYEKIVSEYEKRTSKAPSDRFLMLQLGLTMQQLEQLRKDAQALKILSLNAPIETDEGYSTLEAALEDPTNQFEQSNDRIQNEQLAKELWDIVDSLEPEQSAVIRERYQHNETIAGTAAKLNTTRGKVEGIETKAFRRLRSSKNRKRLLPYIMESDLMYSVSLRHSGLGYFMKSWTSAPERVVLMEEEKRFRSIAN